jgi:hypothetical protein
MRGVALVSGASCLVICIHTPSDPYLRSAYTHIGISGEVLLLEEERRKGTATAQRSGGMLVITASTVIYSSGNRDISVIEGPAPISHIQFVHRQCT